LRSGVVRAWADDLEFVARWLLGGAAGTASVEQNALEVLAMVDLTRMGAFGHYFGGAAAVWTAVGSPAFRAFANLDGRFWGDVLQRGPATPVLLMLAEKHAATDPTIEQFASHAGGRVYTAEIAGALPNNFSDAC
jgi:hypothetical protein